MSLGQLFIIAAPSGAGKTSLVKHLLNDVKQLTVSVSHTTRAMRPGEQHGKDYFFISVEEFQELIAQSAFLEHAQVFDNYYGTTQTAVEHQLSLGSDVILEIDWQGAQQIKHLMPESVSIFILPPSIEVLRQRLQGRGQDDDAVIERRMRDAVAEMSHYAEFDYLIVNDNFSVALTELKSIIISHRLAYSRQSSKLQALLTSLLA